ncbi:DMT family transporter [Cytobacillus spongiae]|uniref:DMT family transporter n=1 Tax=Cytobacillus spongiae TaxID=2901381 RepID=UPI001F19ECD7|nr:DMT family transporter [Cytobacillus spongiae]UII57656.1 DMT family transporter [Cytobacillus spongiae]
MKGLHIYFLPYLLLGIIWGTNFLFMKWAAALINPSQIVFLRVLAGVFPVIVYALIKRQIKWSHFKNSHHFFVMSLLATTIYFFCFAKGTSILSSGIAGALSGSIPIFSTIVTFFLLKEEKINGRKVVGILIEVLGVIIIAKPWVNGDGSLHVNGVVSMIIGSMSVGISFVYAKKFLSDVKIPTAALTSYQMIFALLTISTWTDFTSIDAIRESTPALIGVIVGLGFIGTGLAYILYYTIVNHLGAVVASTVTYIPPIVALFIGAFIAGEKITASDWGGMFVILAGVYLLKNREKKGEKKQEMEKVKHESYM